jgi:hypothetical protein
MQEAACGERVLGLWPAVRREEKRAKTDRWRSIAKHRTRGAFSKEGKQYRISVGPRSVPQDCQSPVVYRSGPSFI